MTGAAMTGAVHWEVLVDGTFPVTRAVFASREAADAAITLSRLCIILNDTADPVRAAEILQVYLEDPARFDTEARVNMALGVQVAATLPRYEAVPVRTDRRPEPGQLEALHAEMLLAAAHGLDVRTSTGLQGLTWFHTIRSAE